MSSRELRLSTRTARDATLLRNKLEAVLKKTKKLTQALPFLKRTMEKLTRDIQDASREKEMIDARLGRLVDKESDIIEMIKREVEQGPHGEQYMILYNRYQRYRELGNSTIDTLRMMQAMIETYRTVMHEQIAEALSNNATTQINKQISDAENEYRKANKKFDSLEQEKQTLMSFINNIERELSELHQESNDLNIQLSSLVGLAGSVSRRKRKKSAKKGGKWSLKYKRSINCKQPKGFSQKQYCKYKNRK